MASKNKREKKAIEKYGDTVDAGEMLDKSNFRKHNLRLFRERIVGLTKSELARRIGVTTQTIYDWESLTKTHCVPSWTNLLKLCEIFNCQPVDLYTDFDSKYLAGMLDDMLELVVTDFNQNIRSNRISDKKLAMKQFEVLCSVRDYQENRDLGIDRDKESENKEVEMHKRRYQSNHEFGYEPDKDEEDE